MCANYRTLWVTLPTNKPAISERPRDPMTMRSTPWVLAGMLRLTDPIRPDATATIQALRDAGVRRVTMLSGDHASVAARIGAALKVDAILAEQSPADKIEAVRAARAQGTTVMVGDGINDAPALAAADVGVAMGARGATASSEAADVVLLVDRLDRLALAMGIARRSRGIAVQSVVVGMGLSLSRWRSRRRDGCRWRPAPCSRRASTSPSS